MNEPASEFVCTMVVKSQEITLSVRRENNDIWRWMITNENVLILNQGRMQTKLAAQVAVQRAFEQRLQRAGINKWGFAGYRWREGIIHHVQS